MLTSGRLGASGVRGYPVRGTLSVGPGRPTCTGRGASAKPRETQPAPRGSAEGWAGADAPRRRPPGAARTPARCSLGREPAGAGHRGRGGPLPDARSLGFWGRGAGCSETRMGMPHFLALHQKAQNQTLTKAAVAIASSLLVFQKSVSK